tara:strand:- start:101314 stop:101922 length:609 start_codon:yes stop_codon:yes gene_type:complete
MSYSKRTGKAPYLLFASVLLFSVACDETSTEIVECWPIDTAVAGAGSIQLGSSLGGFSAFEDGEEIVLEPGGQGGHHIRIVTRIQGLEPGDPTNILSKKNPRTRLRLLDGDGEPITNSSCPVRIPYADEGEGLELSRPYSLVFPLDKKVLRSYDGQPVIVRAEIIDSEGSFATTEHRIIARLPKEPVPLEANSSSHEVATSE